MDSTFVCGDHLTCQEVKACPSPSTPCYPDVPTCRAQCFRPAAEEKECKIRLDRLEGRCQNARGQTLPVTNANCCESNISIQCGSTFSGTASVREGRCVYSEVRRAPSA